MVADLGVKKLGALRGEPFLVSLDRIYYRALARSVLAECPVYQYVEPCTVACLGSLKLGGFPRGLPKGLGSVMTSSDTFALSLRDAGFLNPDCTQGVINDPKTLAYRNRSDHDRPHRQYSEPPLEGSPSDTRVRRNLRPKDPTTVCIKEYGMFFKELKISHLQVQFFRAQEFRWSLSMFKSS